MLFPFFPQIPATLDPIRAPLPASAPAGESPRSFRTGRYRNLFREIGKDDAAIAAKLNEAWRRLFYGDDANERVYYPMTDGSAYVKDVGSGDVRTEGMSYGMMIAVQLDRREEFDRLWRWADRYMRYHDGPWEGYFAWQCDDTGKILGKTPASDGEEYFATALFFAAGRWGSRGAIDDRAEADAILHAMWNRPPGEASPMFDASPKLVVFVPGGAAATFTDPSYGLPAFYELWARWAKEDRAFWRDAAGRSRVFFHKAVDPTTGLAPDYASFAGKPMRAPWSPQGIGDTFGSDAFRVGGNLAMDHAWFGADPWQTMQSDRMLGFFASRRPNYVSGYTVDGKPLVPYKSTGLVAMNAVAALAASPRVGLPFVRALWDAPVPSGQWRYYDGLLYLFGLLHASGQYRVWTPR